MYSPVIVYVCVSTRVSTVHCPVSASTSTYRTHFRTSIEIESKFSYRWNSIDVLKLLARASSLICYDLWTIWDTLVCTSMYTFSCNLYLDLILCDFSFLILNYLFWLDSIALDKWKSKQTQKKKNIKWNKMKMKFNPHYASLLLS